MPTQRSARTASGEGAAERLFTAAVNFCRTEGISPAAALHFLGNLATNAHMAIGYWVNGHEVRRPALLAGDYCRTIVVEIEPGVAGLALIQSRTLEFTDEAYPLLVIVIDTLRQKLYLAQYVGEPGSPLLFTLKLGERKAAPTAIEISQRASGTKLIRVQPMGATVTASQLHSRLLQPYELASLVAQHGSWPWGAVMRPTGPQLNPIWIGGGVLSPDQLAVLGAFLEVLGYTAYCPHAGEGTPEPGLFKTHEDAALTDAVSRPTFFLPGDWPDALDQALARLS